MNYFLSIVSKFKIEAIEFFNAVNLAEDCINAKESVHPGVLFLACIRLSVFWRRRRDILTQHLSDVNDQLGRMNASRALVVETEAEVLTIVSWNVWDSQRNLLEVVILIIDTSISEQSIRDVVESVSSKLAYLMLGDRVIPDPKGLLIWCVIYIYTSSLIFCRDMAQAVVACGIMICCVSDEIDLVLTFLNSKFSGQQCNSNIVRDLTVQLFSFIVN